MSILDDAYEVLRSAGEPLHYREIATRMLKAGWQTESHTPHLTLISLLSMDLQEGPASRFVRVSRGVYGLRGGGGVSADRQSAAEASTAQPPAELSFTDAAFELLSRTEDRTPMHYTALAAVVTESGLVRTTSASPATVLYSSIYGENQRREARGQPFRFVIHKGGSIGLASWIPQGLNAQIEDHNRSIREQLLARLQEGTPKEFEELVGELLVALGFEEVEVTRLSGDGGIDVRGTLVVGEVVRISMAVQAKRWKANVQSPTVQQVRGSLGAHEQGLIITTSDFSSGAMAEARRPNAPPVALMNGDQLVALLAKNEIGVRRERYDLLSLDEPEEADS